MKKIGLKTIESNDRVTMYSICFEGITDGLVSVQENIINGMETNMFEI